MVKNRLDFAVVICYIEWVLSRVRFAPVLCCYLQIRTFDFSTLHSNINNTSQTSMQRLLIFRLSGINSFGCDIHYILYGECWLWHGKLSEWFCSSVAALKTNGLPAEPADLRFKSRLLCKKPKRNRPGTADRSFENRAELIAEHLQGKRPRAGLPL